MFGFLKKKEEKSVEKLPLLPPSDLSKERMGCRYNYVRSGDKFVALAIMIWVNIDLILVEL